MLDPVRCRARQKRLLDRLAGRNLDALVLAAPHHVYYLAAHLPGWQHQAALVLFGDGRSWLVTANSPDETASADQVVCYEGNWNATFRQEQPAVVAAMVDEALKSSHARRVGFDTSLVGAQLSLMGQGRLESIEPDLWQMRRAKDPDELSLMKRAIRCTEAMYERARQIIEPGIPELRVFAELHAAAVESAGEPLSTILGNDWQCGTPGGPPRKDRLARAGEIYILDLGPAYRGYFADNCRAFAVDRRPTDIQLQAFHQLKGVLEIVERMARPGVRCRELYEAGDQHLRSGLRREGMPHHLGHGIGLQPHEYPHLNPKWDDVLIEGEVFTVEPGIYGEELAGGIRVENDYLVTKDGVVNLLEFPMAL